MSEAEIILASLPEYERPVAEIYFGGKFVALLASDSGKVVIETPGPGLDESTVLHRIELGDFLHAVDRARRRLLGE
jgi:hypothetical protein